MLLQWSNNSRHSNVCIVPQSIQGQKYPKQAKYQGTGGEHLLIYLSNKHNLVISIVVRRNDSECQITKERMVRQERTQGDRQCISEGRIRQRLDSNTYYGDREQGGLPFYGGIVL